MERKDAVTSAAMGHRWTREIQPHDEGITSFLLFCHKRNTTDSEIELKHSRCITRKPWVLLLSLMLLEVTVLKP